MNNVKKIAAALAVPALASPGATRSTMPTSSRA